jgi:hypothetical protein
MSELTDAECHNLCVPTISDCNYTNLSAPSSPLVRYAHCYSNSSWDTTDGELSVCTDHLQAGLFVPVSEIKAARRRAVQGLLEATRLHEKDKGVRRVRTGARVTHSPALCCAVLYCAVLCCTVLCCVLNSHCTRHLQSCFCLSVFCVSLCIVCLTSVCLCVL